MTAGAPSSFLTSVSVGAAQTITGDKTFTGTSTFSGAVVMSGGQTLDSLTVSGDTTLGDAATLMVYNSTTNKLNFYNGSAWEVVTSA